MEFVRAASRYSRGDYRGAVELCDAILAKQPKDQAVWQLKCNSLTRLTMIRDTDVEEDPAQGTTTDANPFARQGTSLNQQQNSAVPRIGDGMQRVATSKRMATREGSRMGTRMQTMSGRQVRLGTASLVQRGDKFIEADKLDLKRWAEKKHLAKSLFNYLYYCEQNFKKAVELASYLASSHDNWWSLALARGLFRMGMLDESENELTKLISLESVDADARILLSRVYQKKDQPDKAKDVLRKGLEQQPAEVLFQIELARVQEALGEREQSFQSYNQVLAKECCNLEAVAAIASYYFYNLQGEVSLKLYTRLSLVGCQSPELWNNMALAAFYSGKQGDCPRFFHLALQQAGPQALPDIYFNLGCVLTSQGDIDTATSAYELALEADPGHAESRNNLALLKERKEKREEALALLRMDPANSRAELEWNRGVLLLRSGKFKESMDMLTLLERRGSLGESQELRKALQEQMSF